MEEKLEIGKDMTPIFLEDLGMRYPTENSKRKYRYGLYQCQYCGKELETIQQHVKGGDTTSCGCQSCKLPKHNLSRDRLYKIYQAMLQRCYNVKHPRYNDWGGRGIRVCEEWRTEFSTFVYWATANGYSQELTIDRIDVNKNYEPDNCRWTTRAIQSQNTRELTSRNKSGYRGVFHDINKGVYKVSISVSRKSIYLGSFKTALEAAKAYERYVRLNNLEHNFTPALTEEEIASI